MNKYHYVYKITNTNPNDGRKYYIGVRSSKVKPEDDTNYRSSSTFLKQALIEIGHNNFNKEILSIWETRKEASDEEIRLHELHDVARNPEYYNKAKAKNNMFCTEGYVTVLDIRDNTIKNVTQNDFKEKTYYQSLIKNKFPATNLKTQKISFITQDEFKSGEFQSIHKNTLTVKDTRDNMFKVVSVDEYKKHDYYEFITKGNLPVIDLRDNSHKLVPVADYKKYDYYKSMTSGMMTAITKCGKTEFIPVDEYSSDKYLGTTTTGMVPVKDLKTGKNKLVSKGEFANNEYYVSTQFKKIYIYNVEGELVFETNKTFRIFCKEYNLPEDALWRSYKLNGEPIYQKAHFNTNPNNLKFKGWFATKKKINAD